MQGHCWRSKNELIGDVHLWTLHMDEQRQDDQLEPTYNSSVPIQNVALKTCWKQWTIEKGGERGSEISVPMSRHDDDDSIHLFTYFLFFLAPNSHSNNQQWLICHKIKPNQYKTYTDIYNQIIRKLISTIVMYKISMSNQFYCESLSTVQIKT